MFSTETKSREDGAALYRRCAERMLDGITRQAGVCRSDSRRAGAMAIRFRRHACRRLKQVIQIRAKVGSWML
jgi:hypothetical protein